MGIVYEGFDPLIERSVALKVIRQDDLGAAGSAELRARLKREAQAAGRLTHPGIVAVYEYGEDAGGEGAFIAMEMVRGRELATVLDEGERFAPDEAVRVMRAVLAALQHAHERGVVHRDIKPSNVFLQDDGEVKVADFGVARLDTSDLTQTGAMIGTPSYMSPEQLLGQAVDGRSDLFSCGIVLYQLLTGEKPFTGSVTTVMHKLLHEQAAPPSTLDTSLIPRWDAVMERALAKQPADRYQNAAEFSRAIAAALAEMPQDDSTVIMPPLASPPPRRQRPCPPARSSPPATAPAPPEPAAATRPAAAAPAPVVEAAVPRMSTTAIATAVAALVAAAGGVAWWLARDDTAAASTPTAALARPSSADGSASARGAAGGTARCGAPPARRRRCPRRAEPSAAPRAASPSPAGRHRRAQPPRHPHPRRRRGRRRPSWRRRPPNRSTPGRRSAAVSRRRAARCRPGMRCGCCSTCRAPASASCSPNSTACSPGCPRTARSRSACATASCAGARKRAVPTAARRRGSHCSAATKACRRRAGW